MLEVGSNGSHSACMETELDMLLAQDTMLCMYASSLHSNYASVSQTNKQTNKYFAQGHNPANQLRSFRKFAIFTTGGLEAIWFLLIILKVCWELQCHLIYREHTNQFPIRLKSCCFNLETSQEHMRWNPNPVSGCKQAMK